MSVGSDETEREPAPPSVRRVVSEVRARSGTLRCTIAAAAVWAITLAPLVVTGRASPITRVLALLALLPGIAGPQLVARNHRVARHVGVTAFVVAALATWVMASFDQVLATVDVFRAILGVLGWAVFAVSWSHPWSVPDSQLATAPEGDTVGLKPRRETPHSAVAIAGVGATLSFVCLALAWQVTDPTRAIWAQALAVGASVALLTAGARVSVIAGKEHRREGRPKLPLNRRAINTIVMMLIVAGLLVALHLSR